jgi:hypothetical protein
MRYARPFVVVLWVAAAGCQPGAVKVPYPSQPTLKAVRLVGNRVCGSFKTADGTQFSFTCPALPTISQSGWELTPILAPSTSNPSHTHLNRTAVLTVTAPTLTDIDVELERSGGAANVRLTQFDTSVPGNPGSPEEVALARQVGVSSSDDGTTKTWQITVTVSTCADFRTLDVFDRSSSSPGRSSPLVVTLIRDPDPSQQACVSNGGPALVKSGPGDPTSAPPTGACPGGAGRTVFKFCENCAASHPQQQNVYLEGQYCSWQELLAVYGYDSGSYKSQVCTIRQVAGRQDCEP